jgi:hypothetical protein
VPGLSCSVAGPAITGPTIPLRIGLRIRGGPSLLTGAAALASPAE